MTKVCILFFGLFRKFELSLPSIQKNIFEPLEKNNILFDLYIHTFNLPSYHDEHIGDIVENYDNEQYKLLNIDYNIIVDEQIEIDKTLKFEHFLKKQNPWSFRGPDSVNLMKNVLRQLYSLNNVYTQTINKEYDAYLFVRPDMIYYTPLPLEKITFPIKNEIYLINEYTYGGYCDRFCITSKKGAENFISRYKSIYHCSNLHSEQFLKTILDKSGMDIKFISFHTKRIRSSGAILEG